jgi:hypothetical protein
VVPESFIKEKVLEGQKEFAAAIQAHFTAKLAVNIKFTLLLSRRKYLRLRSLLSCTFVLEDDKWKPLSHNGVLFPKLPGRYLMDAYVAEIKQAFTLKVSADGLSAAADLRTIMAKSIWTSIQEGYYKVENNVVSTLLGEPVPVQFMYDAANHHDKVKVSSLAVQFPGGSLFSSSPSKVNEFFLLEGLDHRSAALELGGPGFDQMNEVIESPIIYLDTLPADGTAPSTLTCPIDPAMGGDQSMQGSFLAIKGCNACNPCPYCTVSAAELCCTDLDKIKTFSARSQESTEILAHTRCGTCPACGQVVTENSKAIEGDKEPAMPKKSTTTWVRAHLGVAYGASFLIKLPVDQWVICLLHANLTQTAALWEKTMRVHIGQHTSRDYSALAQVDLLKEIFKNASKLYTFTLVSSSFSANRYSNEDI